MTSPNLPFGIDVSYWQGEINWGLVAKSEYPTKVLFCAIRAGISWGYSDKWFARNWVESNNIGILRTAYHVLYPGESPQRQMEHFLKIVGDDLGELPLVLDCELDHKKTKNEITDAILASAAILQTKTGKRPIVYSAPFWVNDHTNEGFWDGDWWIANYLNRAEEHPGPPMLPKGVKKERVIMHQTCDKLPLLVNGVNVSQAKATDRNRWQGDVANLYAYANQPVQEPEPSVEQKVDILWNAHPEIH